MGTKAKLIQVIKQYANEHPGNRSHDNGHYFDTPLIGFAAAADPLFEEYKSRGCPR